MSEVYIDARLLRQLRKDSEDLARLRSLIVQWYDRCADGEDGDDYLNGDSNKYPGNGWDDLEAVVKKIR